MWLWLVGCAWFGGEPPGPPSHQRCGDPEANGSCFRPVPAGMGLFGAQASDPDAPGYDPLATDLDEPVRTARMAAFWLMDEPIYLSVWQRCVELGPCRPTTDGEPSAGSGDLAHLLTGVTRNEAEQACAWIGGRLPTADEWEYAARGPQGRRFPWGDAAPCGLGKAYDSWVARSAPACDGGSPVSPRQRGPFGHRDQAWAVTEWVAADVGDGLGMLRGGSWAALDPSDLRAALVTVSPADQRVFDVGVRCAF